MGKKTEQSQAAYDRMAPEYDASPEGRYTRPHKAELIKRVALGEGDSVLDVACGNGSLLRELSKRPGVRTFGVDLSERMIAQARQRHPGGTFAVGPCAPLDFEDDSMDAVTVSCAFHHFERPRAFARECMRVLKRGGGVYLAEPNFSPAVRLLANAVVFPLSRTGDVRVYSRRELRLLFESAGFSRFEDHAAGTVLFFSARK